MGTVSCQTGLVSEHPECSSDAAAPLRSHSFNDPTPSKASWYHGNRCSQFSQEEGKRDSYSRSLSLLSLSLSLLSPSHLILSSAFLWCQTDHQSSVTCCDFCSKSEIPKHKENTENIMGCLTPTVLKDKHAQHLVEHPFEKGNSFSSPESAQLAVRGAGLLYLFPWSTPGSKLVPQALITI